MQLWTALLLGLAGSLHCAGMCGPLAIALPGLGAAGWRFALGRLAYNLGRIATYSVLGIVFGLLGRTLLLAGVQRWVSIGLGLVLLAGLLSSRQLGVWRPVLALVGFLRDGMGGLLRRHSLLSMAGLGLLNGLLPCGMVYVAGAGAVMAGGLLSSVEYMVVFGLGTLPLMLALSLSGRLVPLGFRLQLRKAIPASVFLLATLLLLRGLGLGIPYVSPDLSTPHPSCCQP